MSPGIPLLALALSAAAGAGRPALLLAAGDMPPVELVRVPPRPGAERPLLVGRFEITNAQYEAFVQATGYDGREAPSSKPTETFLSHFVDGRCPAELRTRPACNLNLAHVEAFCRWLSARTGRVVRLPTDVEWTWIAAGGSGRSYPWGDEWEPTRCNWGDGGATDGFAVAAPVGSFPAGVTPEGVHDLAGNAWEWTADGHQRGGPWCLPPEMMRCTVLGREDAFRVDDKFGFRVVVELPR